MTEQIAAIIVLMIIVWMIVALTKYHPCKVRRTMSVQPPPIVCSRQEVDALRIPSDAGTGYSGTCKPTTDENQAPKPAVERRRLGQMKLR